MAWGFLDWVRGRPFFRDPKKLTLPENATQAQLQAMALLLLDGREAYDAYKLLGEQSDRACPIIESLLRNNPAFRRMDVELRGWGKPRLAVILSILLEWESEYAAEQALALADAPEVSLRQVAAQELARTGRERFVEVLGRLSRDPEEDVRGGLARGLSDSIQYMRRDGARCDASLAAAMYDFMLESLAVDRPGSSEFPAAMVKVDRDRAVRDLVKDEMLTVRRRGISRILEAVRKAKGVVPLPRLRALLTDAIAIFDRPGFQMRDHPTLSYAVKEILRQISFHDADEAARLMKMFRGHPQEEARSAAHMARSELRPDPFSIACDARDAAGSCEAMRLEHRVVYLSQVFFGEIGNGGWLQWVANLDGKELRETESALREIGAHAAADEVNEALRLLGPGGVSSDQQHRMKAIDRLLNSGQSLPDDSVIWRMETEWRELLLDYAERHPEAF